MPKKLTEAEIETEAEIRRKRIREGYTKGKLTSTAISKTDYGKDLNWLFDNTDDSYPEAIKKVFGDKYLERMKKEEEREKEELREKCEQKERELLEYAKSGKHMSVSAIKNTEHEWKAKYLGKKSEKYFGKTVAEILDIIAPLERKGIRAGGKRKNLGETLSEEEKEDRKEEIIDIIVNRSGHEYEGFVSEIFDMYMEGGCGIDDAQKIGKEKGIISETSGQFEIFEFNKLYSTIIKEIKAFKD